MEQEKYEQPWVLVRGAGDLATGVITRLHRCGFRVVATECAAPSAIRRSAALCEAVWRNLMQVEDVVARRITTAAQAAEVAQAGEVPLLVDEAAACIDALHPAAVVDAIIAKRNVGTHRGMAPITVGLGPGFTAGQDVDAVIETMRGHQLGRVIWQGTAIPDTGVPGDIEGYALKRVIHAPSSGTMRYVPDGVGHLVDIGTAVQAGQVIARIDATPVYATIDGVLRGLIRVGYPVTKGLKIADIDPRPEQITMCETVSDKALAIGGGVVEALLMLARERSIRLL